MADPGKLGGKLGPRLASHLSRAATHHLRESAAIRSKIELNAKLGVFRTMTAETRGTIGPLFRELAEHEENPEYLRRTLEFLAHGSGEFQAVVSALTTAESLTPGIGQLIANDFAIPIQNLIARKPNALLSPDAAARAAAFGLWSQDHAALEAARGGLSENRFAALQALAVTFPDFQTALELLRRGAIGHQDVTNWLTRQGVDQDAQHHLLALERQHIPPAMAAEMVLRGIISEDAGRGIAKIAGYTAGDFDAMVLDTGEPPAVQELLFLYRRGKIDRTRLEHGIRQSRVRNEWIDAVEALQHVPMSVGEAVAAVVQGHLSDAEGRRIAEENGLEPAQWTPILETHGRPPGVQEMAALFNRGEIGRARFEQAIRESDIKNKYIPDLVKIRRHLMPERTVVSAISKGVFTHRQGVTHLLDIGFNAADAEALASEATNTKTGGHKELAVGTILTLYESHTIDRAQAHDSIAVHGYSKEEIGWLLAMAEVRRLKAERDHLLGVLRARYVAHHIDANYVLGQAGALGVPNAELERLLRMWEVERGANPRQLTEAQVIRLYKKGLIDQSEALARHVAMGYSDADAGLLIQAAG